MTSGLESPPGAFHFTLHEVDPTRHSESLTITREIAQGVPIVESSPEGCLAFRRFYELWREAMESVGRFEEYRSLEYWVDLVEAAGLEVEFAERVAQDFLWRRIDVPEGLIRDMLEFPEYAEAAGGMRWSDLLVVPGRDALQGSARGPLLSTLGAGPRATPWIAVIIPAALFSLVHVAPLSKAPRVYLASVMTGAFVLGLLASLFRAVSGSLAPAVVTHACLNLVGMLVEEILG
ncbi:MAG: CPBP family intramembrane metalloprotease [Candidatus Korarchaeota archaeon]|nr:CPBP family intramembrane metalloprotease [Candidatus Korarchaeota archaeon]